MKCIGASECSDKCKAEMHLLCSSGHGADVAGYFREVSSWCWDTELSGNLPLLSGVVFALAGEHFSVCVCMN